MAIDSTDLALVTARVKCCRLGAARLGFTPYDVKGPGSPYPCEYIWREVQPPTTQWTLLTEGVVCGKRPVASFSMVAVSEYVIPDPPVAGFTPAQGPWGDWEVAFTDTSTGDVVSWYWDFGDGVAAYVQNPVHTYANEGPWTVTLTVANAGGRDSDSQLIEWAPF